jgi:hypothetical protein
MSVAGSWREFLRARLLTHQSVNIKLALWIRCTHGIMSGRNIDFTVRDNRRGELDSISWSIAGSVRAVVKFRQTGGVVSPQNCSRLHSCTLNRLPVVDHPQDPARRSVSGDEGGRAKAAGQNAVRSEVGSIRS